MTPDEAVVRQMMAVGADLSRATEVNVYLYFAAEAAAQQVATLLLRTGFAEVSVSPSLRSQWACIGSTRMVPDLAEIEQMSALLRGVASAYGGEYDGWEAAVELDDGGCSGGGVLPFPVVRHAFTFYCTSHAESAEGAEGAENRRSDVFSASSISPRPPREMVCKV